MLGRNAPVEVEQVDRAPGRGVEEDALPAGHLDREVGEVGDSCVGDDQRHIRVRLDQAREPVGDRRQPAPAVDQDRDAALPCELEHRREPSVGRVEPLRARVQLDPACARVEAPRGLLDRRLVQVEPHERDQAALRALRERESAVVRGAEGGVAVRLVEAEHEGARDPVPGHHLLEVVVVADHPVDVGAEVEMRVEDVRARRHHPSHLAVVQRRQLERPVQYMGHPRKLTTTG